MPQRLPSWTWQFSSQTAAHINTLTDFKVDFKTPVRNVYSKSCIKKPVTQSEQCHSIDLVNLLITSKEMFSLFLWYYLWNGSHPVILKSGFLMWYKISTKYPYCGNLKMHSQLRKFYNKSHFFCCWQERLVNCSCKLSDWKRLKSCISVWPLIRPWNSRQS